MAVEPPTAEADLAGAAPPLRQRLERLHARWGRVFWALHSVWALVTGAGVLVLAHNRYGFVPWMALFLGLTWASTLYFSRLAPQLVSPAGRFARGFVSYLTRVMYQETLFFLLPFYMYSTTVPSANAAYTLLLAGLAVLSCLDLPFDRLLRTRPWFGFAFFFLVTFSALQLLLPLIVHLPVHWSSEIAAGAAFSSAVPLASNPGLLRNPRRLLRLGGGLVLTLVAVRLLLPVIPPVPLRLSKVRFAGQFDRAALRAPHEFEHSMPLAELHRGELYSVVTLFAPTHLASNLVLRLTHQGREVRRSRDIEAIAHRGGYRIWDMARAPAGGFRPGSYTLVVRTREGQLVGRARLEVRPGG